MTARAALLLAIAALAPAARAGVRPAHGGTVRIALPAGEGDGAREPLLDRALSAPLLDLDAEGRLLPGALAEVPRPEAGGRAFRLRLRPGLRDAGGRPIGAADVAARLSSLLRPGSPSAWVALPILGADALAEGSAALLAGVQILSAEELLVTLAFPLPEFPWLLATAPAALPGAGPFAGAGPGTAGDPILLLRNDHHHEGRPFADAIELSSPDARTAARLLERGALDLVLRPEAAGGIPGPALPALTATVARVNGPRLGQGAEGVRRVLAALDRADLARRFVRGPAEPLASLVPPALLPAGAPEPEAAPDRAAPPPPDRLVLLADASGPGHRELAGRIQVKLFDGGVRATVELVPPDRLRERLASGDFDVALLSVRVQAVKPSLAAAQVIHAVRGPAAARRALAELSGLEGVAALDATARLARELDLFPLVASGPRAALGPALRGLSPAADGGFDPGSLWRLGGGGP